MDTRADTIRHSLERSLERMGTSYLDLYLYHAPPAVNSIAEGREALERLKQDGKIRYYGISTNDPEVLGQLANHNAADVVLLSQSLLTHHAELLEIARKCNLGIMVRGALERGRLSGSYFHHRPEFSVQDIRHHAFQGTDFEAYAVYERFLPHGIPMATFALRYLMDFDTTHTILLGGRSIEQYRNAMRALELPSLDPQTHRALRKVRARLTGKSAVRRILRGAYHSVGRVIHGFS